MSYSPSQLLMSHITRTKIPIARELLQQQVATNIHKQLKLRQELQKKNYDKGTKSLPPLTESERIRIRQDKIWVPAQVSRRRTSAPRSYVVTTADGQEYRRNRRDLLKTNEVLPVKTEPPEFDNSEQFNVTNNIQQPVSTTSIEPSLRRSTRKSVQPVRFKDYSME